MQPRILIADPDDAFGLMLKQVLELNGDYTADHVSTAERALAAAQKQSPDLLIADMSIVDVPSLVASIRQTAPQMRVMLIPLGDALPAEMHALGVQGILTKPFFIGDLGEQIASVLGIEVKPLVELPPPPEKKAIESKPRVRQAHRPTRSAVPVSVNGNGRKSGRTAPAGAPTTPEPVPPEPIISTTPTRPRVRPRSSPLRVAPSVSAATSPADSTTTRVGTSVLDPILLKLVNEIRAEAVVVVKDNVLLAQCSNFSAARVEMLVERIVRWRKAASELSSFVGERSRFQQSHLEGDRYHLYAYDVSESLLLVTICRNDIPFGTLRLNMRSAASEIGKQLR